MKRFIYKPKYARLIIYMRGKISQIDDLARVIGANAGHLRIVLDQWFKEGIIDKNKPGRDYKIRLTKKGDAVGIKLAELMHLDNHWEEMVAEEKKAEEKKAENKKKEGDKHGSNKSNTL